MISFVARQTSPHSRVTCHSWGLSLPLPLNAVIEGGDIPGVLKHTGLHLKPIGRALSLWQRECCHLTDVTICVRENSTSAPSSYDCNLLEVQSCELNAKSDAGFSEPLLDGGKPILLVTDSTMENVKFSSESQLGHLRGTAHKKDVWVFSSWTGNVLVTKWEASCLPASPCSHLGLWGVQVILTPERLIDKLGIDSKEQNSFSSLTKISITVKVWFLLDEKD